MECSPNEIVVLVSNVGEEPLIQQIEGQQLGTVIETLNTESITDQNYPDTQQTYVEIDQKYFETDQKDSETDPKDSLIEIDLKDPEADPKEPETDPGSLLEGEDCADETELKYTCAANGRKFKTISGLHAHMKEHGSGGSYYFDHITNTAFPKYDTFCSYTQTDMEVQLVEDDDRDSEDDFDSEMSEILREEQTFQETDSEAEMVDDKSKIQVKVTGQANKRKRRSGNGGDSDEDYDPEMEGKKQKRVYKKHKQTIDIKPDGTEEIKIEPVDDWSMEDNTPLSGNKKKTTVRSNINRTFVRPAGKRVIKRKRFDDFMDDKENDDVYQEMEDHDSYDVIPVSEESFNVVAVSEESQSQETLADGESLETHRDSQSSEIIKDVQSQSSETLENGGSPEEGKENSSQDTVKKPKKPKHEKTEECGICEQKVPNEEFEEHIMSAHPGERPFICEICGHSFTTRRLLRRHTVTHRDSKPWRCDYCEKTFIQRNERDVHTRRKHTGERPFECKVCAKKFYCAKTLGNHMANVHMGVTKFECELCGRRFYKKSGLEIHQATHYEAQMKCQYCDRRFRDKTGLKRHENTHTGKKNYHCHICDKGFIQSTPFWDHMEKKHGMDRNKLKDKLQQIRESNKRSGKPTMVQELPVDVDLESLMMPPGHVPDYRRTSVTPKKKKVVKLPKQEMTEVTEVTEHKIIQEAGQSVIHLDNLSLDLPQLISSQGGLGDKTIIIIEKDYLDLANSQGYQEAIAYATEEIGGKPADGQTVLIAGSTEDGIEQTVQNIEIPVNFAGDSNEVTVVTLPTGASNVAIDMPNQDQSTQCVETEVANF